MNPPFGPLPFKLWPVKFTTTSGLCLATLVRRGALKWVFDLSTSTKRTESVRVWSPNWLDEKAAFAVLSQQGKSLGEVIEAIIPPNLSEPTGRELSQVLGLGTSQVLALKNAKHFKTIGNGIRADTMRFERASVVEFLKSRRVQ